MPLWQSIGISQVSANFKTKYIGIGSVSKKGIGASLREQPYHGLYQFQEKLKPQRRTHPSPRDQQCERMRNTILSSN